jgi:endonuclease/exonuclease/phosphatase family metal-dependent hydrolase
VSPPTLRIMTWNVYGTFSRNPHFDLQGVIALIEKWSPDIAALQEIDSRGRDDNPFVLLEDAFGGHSIGAKSIVTADGEYGQMLISRWPWVNLPVITDISFPEREPRRAIAAEIATPHGGFCVIATHLGLSFRERHQQVRTLLTLAEKTPYPAAIVGDLNDWLWINSVRGVLAKCLQTSTAHKTFPARWPLMKLDRIYGREIRILRSWVDKTARKFSDHLPVIADIELLRRDPDAGAKSD